MELVLAIPAPLALKPTPFPTNAKLHASSSAAKTPATLPSFSVFASHQSLFISRPAFAPALHPATALIVAIGSCEQLN